MLRNAWPMAAVSCLFLIGGCSDNDDGGYGRGPAGPLVTGSLELRWTILGSTDAEACEAIGAIDFETVVSDGFAVSELEADCAEFSAPMTLYVGDYVARSRLVDANDTTITHRVFLDRVRVLEDEVTVVNLDFPSDFVVLPGDEADAGVPPVDEPDAEAPPPEDEVDAGDAAAPPEEPADAGADAEAP